MGAERSLQSVILKDEDGNPVGIVQDGIIYRLQTSSKLTDSHGGEAPFSAFNLLKIANENIIADYRFDSTNTPNDFTIVTTGTGGYSHEAGGTGVKLSTGASASSKVTFESKNDHYYQSGRGQLIKFSIILGDSGVANNTREWGYADSNNGVFFRMDGTTLKFVIRRDGSEVYSLASSSWNTPVTVDQYGHLYYIQLQWLGVGDIYFWYDNQIVHKYSFLGTSTYFNIGNPDLPLWFRNENGTNTSDVYMKCGCCAVCMEGGTVISGQDDDGIIREAKVDEKGHLAVVPRKFIYGDDIFRRTDNSNTAMNIDGTDDNTESLWDGTGVSDTGSDWTRGGVGSETTGSAYSGTNGLDSGVTSQNDESYFDFGSNRDIPTLFDKVTFWMQPKAYPGSSDLRVGWRPDGGGGTIGSLLSVSSYTANMNLDVWQKVEIPIADFGLDSNAGRFRIRYAGAASQQFWFDDIDLIDESGEGTKTFRVEAPAGEKWRIEEIRLIVVSGDTGWDSDAFATIASGIPNGLTLRHRDLAGASNYWNINVTDNVELFGRFHYSEPFTFGDTELLVVFKMCPKLATITVTDNDVLDFLVKDDLRALTNMRAYVDYGLE